MHAPNKLSLMVPAMCGTCETQWQYNDEEGEFNCPNVCDPYNGGITPTDLDRQGVEWESIDGTLWEVPEN